LEGGLGKDVGRSVNQIDAGSEYRCQQETQRKQHDSFIAQVEATSRTT
jgi:hypothetical protein